ncbi:hypothetical protein [Aquisediminimonas sediminicola]|nr:hypothetical protein [Aquisediminimonas sediminicola]
MQSDSVQNNNIRPETGLRHRTATGRQRPVNWPMALCRQELRRLVADMVD